MQQQTLPLPRARARVSVGPAADCAPHARGDGGGDDPSEKAAAKPRKRAAPKEWLASEHHFVRACELLVPGVAAPPDLPPAVSGGYFYRVQAPLRALLTADFLGRYASEGRLLLLSDDAASDSGNMAALLPGGPLVLALDRDTHELLGLDAAQSQFGALRRRRFIARVDVAAPSFLAGTSRLYERLHWCLAPERVGSAALLVAAWDADGRSREIVFPPDAAAAARKEPLNVATRTLRDILVPDVEAALGARGSEAGGSEMRGGDEEEEEEKTGGDEEEAEALAEEVLHWLGLAHCGAEALLRHEGLAQPESFLASAFALGSLAGLCTRGALTAMRVRGLLSPPQQLALLSEARRAVDEGGAPWAAVTFWGVPDAPVSWRGAEHALLSRGEHDCVLVALPRGRVARLSLQGGLDAAH